MGGEIHARAGLSGLNDDRAALGRRQGGQWSAHIIVAAAEIDDMDLVRIAEPAGVAIENYGIALDAVPQRHGDMQVLLRLIVARVVLDHLLVAPVRRFVLGARGHRVPGNAALGDVVERVERARDVKGMVIGGRHGDAETDPVRHARHARDHRHHVVARPLGSIAHRGAMVAAVVLRGAAGIAEEQQVHDPARCDARDVLVEFRAAVIGIALPRAGHLPEIVGMIMREIGSEMNDFRFGHGLLP